MILRKIDYKELNSRQKESYNFQKVSAVLADYGFTTIKLSDDWQGADFIAQHISGEFIKVQLKGRLEVNKHYFGKEIMMCFRYDEKWYLGSHDEILKIVETGIENTKSWDKDSGKYSWVKPSKKLLDQINKYEI
jgi:hypothetical protein